MDTFFVLFKSSQPTYSINILFYFFKAVSDGLLSESGLVEIQFNSFLTPKITFFHTTFAAFEFVISRCAS